MSNPEVVLAMGTFATEHDTDMIRLFRMASMMLGFILGSLDEVYTSAV